MPKKITITNLNKSKLIKLLIKLDAKTVKAFKAYYKQLGNSERDAFLILEHLLSYYPEFDSPNLLQDVAFKKIFGKAVAYDYRKLMKGVSQVHVDLKQYLVNKMVAEDESLNNFLLAKVYTKYDLPHERQLLIDKQLPPKITPNHPDDFFNLLQWEDLSFFSEGSAKKQPNQQGITRAMTALDWYYLGHKLKYACEISTQKRLYNLAYTINFEASITTFCQKNFNTLPLYHKTYFTAWQLNYAPNTELFARLKTIYFTHYKSFPSADQLYLLTHLLNFSIAQIRKKVPNAMTDTFDIYRFGIENQILIINNFFIDSHFINLIIISSVLQKFNWIEKLLSDKLGVLVKANSPSTYNIAMARLNFAKSNFKECLSFLIDINYKIFEHSCKARSYQIACAYELKADFLIIESHCKSFENFLRRNATKHPKGATAYLNFINLVRQLNKINPNKNKLKASFNKASPISFYEWLEQKINLLK